MTDDARQAYEAMGFSRWDGVTPKVDYDRWQQIKESQRLDEIRARLLLQRDQPRCPIVVPEGYVVGFIPAQTLSNDQLEKMLSTLTEGITRGLQTTEELARYRREQR